LSTRIDAAEVVDPEAPRRGQAAARVFFGATVRYATGSGVERTVSIVGVDEVDLHKHYISWVSPLARALMKKAPGERAVLYAPGGTEQLEILEVNYERIEIDPYQEPPGAQSASK
jgi:transcription elongation factor GreB